MFNVFFFFFIFAYQHFLFIILSFFITLFVCLPIIPLIASWAQSTRIGNPDGQLCVWYFVDEHFLEFSSFLRWMPPDLWGWMPPSPHQFEKEQCQNKNIVLLGNDVFGKRWWMGGTRGQWFLSLANNLQNFVHLLMGFNGWYFRSKEKVKNVQILDWCNLGEYAEAKLSLWAFWRLDFLNGNTP